MLTLMPTQILKTIKTFMKKTKMGIKILILGPTGHSPNTETFKSPKWEDFELLLYILKTPFLLFFLSKQMNVELLENQKST